MNDYGLNHEQWESINLKGPCSFTLASAGSGKTKCLTSKVRHIIDSKIGTPETILAITFTIKAANEMKERLKKHVDVSKMQISTMHSMCVKIIRAFIHLTYLKMPFTIYDTSDQLSIVKTIVKARNLPGNPFDYLSEIGKSKSLGIEPEDQTFLIIYKQYQEILKQNNAADFDDLLLLAFECLKNEACKNYFSNKWQHILIDEFQDTSLLQLNLIMSLYTDKTKTIYATGDPNQSIYKFRNARPENITEFIEKYKANTINLTYNYRSCQEVIDIANNFQQFGEPMVPKTSLKGKVSVASFGSYEDEAEQIAQAIMKLGNYGSTAVIYRVNGRSLLFEQTFSRYRIPYKVVNDRPFFQRKVVKDLLSALKSANNLEDRESLSRIINHPKRGFGDAKKEKLLMQGRAYAESIAEEMPQIKDFLGLLGDMKGLPPSAALDEYLNRSGYVSSIEKDTDRYLIESLKDAVANYDSVEELILASSFLEKDNDGENAVSLITAHGSKGLEFDNVFVVGVEEGLWPHKYSDDLDEESRLFYVSLSRAKICLNISYCASRLFKGSLISVSPSYLFEQTKKYLQK
jgi:DNA helicase-2/ATP-dependent DNA helicase PcrA